MLYPEGRNTGYTVSFNLDVMIVFYNFGEYIAIFVKKSVVKSIYKNFEEEMTWQKTRMRSAMMRMVHGE